MEDNSEIIIEEVKKYDFLYNLSSKEYKNVQKKTEIWEKIGSSLNMPGDLCKKRWRGLRDTYKRHKRAAQLASGSAAPSPKKKWKYMDSMRFLDNYSDSRPTIGSIDDVLDDSQYLLDCSISTDMSSIINTQNSDDSNDVNVVQPKRNTKKQADAEISSIFKSVMKECSDTVKCLAQNTNSNGRDRDTTFMLFESLAAKISEAHLRQDAIRRIERKVMALVYEELEQSCVT